MGLFSKKDIVNLDVQGMHCPKCVARVTAALEGVEGVTKAKVSLESASAKVEGHGFDSQALIDAVKETGFEASLAQ